jgi:hypothetical protein
MRCFALLQKTKPRLETFALIHALIEALAFFATLLAPAMVGSDGPA